MAQGHIKLTIACLETNNVFRLDLNMNEKQIDIDLNDFEPDNASELFGEVMAGVVDMLGIRKKFINTLQEMMDK